MSPPKRVFWSEKTTPSVRRPWAASKAFASGVWASVVGLRANGWTVP